MEGIKERIWLGTASRFSHRERGKADVQFCPRKDIKDLALDKHDGVGLWPT